MAVRWGLAGHDAAVERLERALNAGTLAHGYLIVGPEGVGKTTLALRLAQAVNCDGAIRPCGECRACTRIAAGRHPDVMTMTLGRPDLGFDPERPNERDLGIGRVRALEHAAALQPFEGKNRVFIIDGAERLSREAQNALLKTLEEPPPAVLLLLVTAEEDGLLPTIRSRVQRMGLALVGHEVIAAHLREEFHMDAPAAGRLGRLAQGQIAWAVGAARDPEILQRRGSAQAELLELAGAGTDRRFVWAASRAAEFSKSRASVFTELQLALDLWHDMLLLKAVGPECVSDDTLTPQFAAIIQRLDIAALVGAVTALRRTISHLERNANPRLALEVLMLDLPAAGVVARVA